MNLGGQVKPISAATKVAADKTTCLQSCSVDLFRQLIDGDIRRRADQDLPLVLLDQMEDGRGGGHGLPRPRWSLDERQGSLQHRLDGVHLGMVQFGKSRCGETLWKLAFQYDVLNLISDTKK
jgi:hypothetical protein